MRSETTATIGGGGYLQNASPDVRRRVTKKLPKGFEKAIIELEFQMEKGHITHEVVSMLLSLYSVR